MKNKKQKTQKRIPKNIPLFAELILLAAPWLVEGGYA